MILPHCGICCLQLRDVTRACLSPAAGACDGERTLNRNGRMEPMITLYGMGSPNVVKIFIALEELALPYTVEPVDVFSGKQFDEAFLKLNPNAKAPVIVDSDGPGARPY